MLLTDVQPYGSGVLHLSISNKTYWRRQILSNGGNLFVYLIYIFSGEMDSTLLSQLTGKMPLLVDGNDIKTTLRYVQYWTESCCHALYVGVFTSTTKIIAYKNPVGEILIQERSILAFPEEISGETTNGKITEIRVSKFKSTLFYILKLYDDC